MKNFVLRFALLSPAALAAASCAAAADVETDDETVPPPYSVAAKGTYDQPWAAAFVPGTEVLVITTQDGEIHGYDGANDQAIFITGAPEVAYGGQGGLGDIAFLESEAADTLSDRTIYLTWAEAGDDRTRGAVLGKGTLVCEDHQSCDIRDLEVIWRQTPKVTGEGHYSHRIRFSPDGQYIFVASGDRQKLDPAQDTSNTIGTIVRLNLDGTPAEGNPLADQGSPSDEIWSWGHRNILGMDWDAEGRLWEVEHGPRNGDELNLVKRGANYGWPVVSEGRHYRGENIPDHDTRPEFDLYAVTWTPVIAPGDMVIYDGDMFTDWQGDALIAGLKAEGLVRVEIDGENASEAARYNLGNRIRTVDIGPDGALWVLEDGEGARLLKLTAN